MSQQKAKKLVLVLTISTSLIEDSEVAILVIAKQLEQVTYIQYFIVFPGGVTQNSSALDSMLALFDSSS